MPSIPLGFAPVVDLISLTATEGLLPMRHGSVTLSAAPLEPITWFAPFSEVEVYPAPGTWARRGGARLVSTGPGQWTAIGPFEPPEGAAMADQTDAWAAMVLDGPDARDVLARLTSIDLRDDRFGAGAAARTLLGNVPAALLCADIGRYEILVPRSMAATAAHDLGRAMRLVAARSSARG